jgi:N-acetylglucosaminyldiphosphoundecaprenol N-acetyl-beta-D-mannosaminyltransferase
MDDLDPPKTPDPFALEAHLVRPASVPFPPPAPRAPTIHIRARLFGVEIDPLRMDQAVRQILAWVHNREDRRCQFVVTPNVDHVVLLQHRADLRAAYRDAGLVLADGAPVVWSSHVLRQPLPERVAGSDLVPALFDAANLTEPLRVFLLGAGPGVAERAAANIHRRWPAVRVVGTCSPPPGFERDDAQNEAILSRIADAQADVLIVGLGAPKQELWVHRHQPRLAVKAALCVGATIDFLAGEKSRAPRWMRRAGLEWLFRAASEPRRLAGRYARDAWIFPQLLVRQWWQSRRGAGG